MGYVYHIRGFALFVDNLISLEFFIFEAKNQFANLICCPMLENWQFYEEIDILLCHLVMQLFDKTLIIRFVYHGERTVSFTFDGRSPRAVIYEGQFSKGVA